MTEFQHAKFAIDALPNQHFVGYSDGNTWNGFACPYFEKQTAEQILVKSEKNGYRWEYEPEQDTFYVRSVDDPADYASEEFQGIEINIDGQPKKVYGIGAYYWVWSLTN